MDGPTWFRDANEDGENDLMLPIWPGPDPVQDPGDFTPGDAVAYICQWTVDGPDHAANIDLVMGAWGNGTTADERALVSLLYRRSESSFMVIDAAPRLEKVSGLASAALARNEVIGTWIAQSAFLVVDVVWDDDPRIADLLAAR